MIGVTVILSMLALPAAPYAQEIDPVVVITAPYEAGNAGDVEAGG